MARAEFDVSTRFHHLTTYAPTEQVKQVLTGKSEQLVFAECILHDKDVKEDGSPKEPHVHVLIELKSPRYLTDVCKWFKKCLDNAGRTVTTRSIEISPTTQDADDYLTHKGELTKHQYADEDVKVLVGSRDDFRDSKIDKHHDAAEGDENNKADEVENLLQDVVDKVPLRQMARRYGRDFIKNYNAYRNYALQIVAEETGELPDHLVNDPLNEMINRKCRESSEITVHRTVGVVVDVFRDAMLERLGEGVAESIFEIAQQKMYKKGIKK